MLCVAICHRCEWIMLHTIVLMSAAHHDRIIFYDAWLLMSFACQINTHTNYQNDQNVPKLFRGVQYQGLLHTRTDQLRKGMLIQELINLNWKNTACYSLTRHCFRQPLSQIALNYRRWGFINALVIGCLHWVTWGQFCYISSDLFSSYFEIWRSQMTYYD